MRDRYFLQIGSAPESEVTKEEWVTAERNAGFVNEQGQPSEPATGSFSTSKFGGVRGRIEYNRGSENRK